MGNDTIINGIWTGSLSENVDIPTNYISTPDICESTRTADMEGNTLPPKPIDNEELEIPKEDVIDKEDIQDDKKIENSSSSFKFISSYLIFFIGISILLQ